MKEVEGKLRIVYMGTPEYAAEILRKLLEQEDMEVVLVLTQPDRPVGRKRILTPPPVKTLALEKGLRLLQPERLNDPSVLLRIREARPDRIVVAAYGQILPQSVLRIAPCINLHASLLPAYRGASPIQQVLLAGECMTGVTAMLMEEGLDSGPVLAYAYEAIPGEIRRSELTKRLTRVAADLTPKVLRRFEELKPLAQWDASASYCRKIRREEGIVTLDSARDLLNRYRAFEGWPGVALASGVKLIELERAEEEQSHRPGEILELRGESIRLGCRHGSVWLHRIQPPSKKPMSARAYMVGRGLKVGDSLL